MYLGQAQPCCYPGLGFVQAPQPAWPQLPAWWKTALVAAVIALVLYRVFFGKPARRRRRNLQLRGSYRRELLRIKAA